jgi:D123
VIPTLRCTSPADVYLLLKSSDFISHDLNPQLAFAGCPYPSDGSPSFTTAEHPIYDLELVLKKWYSVDKGREFRCFVRDDILLG